MADESTLKPMCACLNYYSTILSAFVLCCVQLMPVYLVLVMLSVRCLVGKSIYCWFQYLCHTISDPVYLDI